MVMKDLNAVWFKGKLYVGGMAESLTCSARLYIYSPAIGWSKSVVAPSYKFALVTYQSRLLLIGGKKYVEDNETGSNTNIIWEYDTVNSKFVQYLEMKTSCVSCAVSHGDLLVIACQEHVPGDIEIYNGSKWWTILLPHILHEAVLLAYFDHCLYLKSGVNTFYTSWESLKKNNEGVADLDWKDLTDMPRELSWGGLAVFRHRLVVTNGTTIFAYSSHTKNWVQVSSSTENESSILSTCAVVLPDKGEMMILGGESAQEEHLISDRVLTVSLDVDGR